MLSGEDTKLKGQFNKRNWLSAHSHVLPLFIWIPVYIHAEFIIEADRNCDLFPQGENESWKP